MRRLAPIPVFLTFSASRELFFAIVFTMNLVYQTSVVGLNPLQLILVGTVLEATTFLFEIPTGVVADLYSRRLSVIIGCVLIGAGFILEGSLPTFTAVIASQVLWGLGYTFTSGSTEAWISDEIGEERAGQAFLKGAQAGLVGGLVGTLISAALGSIRVNIPILAGGACFMALALFLAIWMPEHGFAPAFQRQRQSPRAWIAENYRSMLSTTRAGLRLVRGSAPLLMILSVGLFLGLYSEGFDRLWTPHLIRDIGMPVSHAFPLAVWFGGIAVTASLLTLGATALAQRFANPDNPRLALRVMLGTTAGTLLGLVVLALSRSIPVALAAYWVIAVTRSLRGPYYTTWVNRQLPSAVRATVLSMSSQVDALGQIVGGPVLGIIGTAISIPAALAGSAVLLLPALPLLARAMRREDSRGEEIV